MSLPRRDIPILVIVGVLVAALSLRGPIVAPTVVLRDIEADLGLSAGTAGLLTTAPVLMFAVITPLAVLAVRRAGAERALMLSLSGVMLGTLLRFLPGFWMLLLGMIVIGASVTIGNVVVPVIIRREVEPARVAFVAAAYTATLNVGSMLTSLGTAPLASLVGWPLALMLWSVLTIAGIALWGVHMSRVRARGKRPGERYSGAPRTTPIPVLTRAEPAGPELDPATITGPLPVIGARGLRGPRLVALLLMGAFGLQCFCYYALTTWLPAFGADLLSLDRAGAGAMASIYQGVGIAGAFVVPLMARRMPLLVPAVVVCASWVVLMLGLILAPQLLWLWLSIGAIGHAGGFVVIFTVLVAVARSDADAAGMSALVQGGGYVLGALGGPALGLTHEALGGWTVPLLGLLALSVAYTIVLLGAVLASARR